MADTTDQPRRRRTDAPLTLAYLQALLGRGAPRVLGPLPDPGPGPVTAADGCTGRATLGLGPLPDPAGLVGRLGHQASQQVPDDERVRRSLDAWSACTDAAGHPFATPREALDFPWTTAPPGQEVAAATADVACKAAADLPGTWQRVEAEAQAPLVAANLAALTAVEERSRAQVAGPARCYSPAADPPKHPVCPALLPLRPAVPAHGPCRRSP